MKLLIHLDKRIKKVTKTKYKKLKKLAKDETLKKHVSERLTEHLDLFTFYNDFYNYCEEFLPDIITMANLMTLRPASHDVSDISTDSEHVCEPNMNNITPSNPSICNDQCNSATLVDGRYEGKFVSPNVINLSKRNLSKDEISLLSKGLKFVPTPRHINKAKIKEELEIFGRKLRLMWHFRNDEREFTTNLFKKKSKFNPRNKDPVIEIYLSRLEDEIMSLQDNLRYNNLTKGERNAMFALRDDTSIIIKEADKGSGVVVWDRDDYLQEAENQLKDKEVYKELKGDVESPIIKIVKNAISKVHKRRDISEETLDYFLVNNPKVGRFYLLPKIHKRLHNVPGRPVISNSGYFTENISSFVEYHLKPLA